MISINFAEKKTIVAQFECESSVMAESVIIEEALAALQKRLHALAEPAAVAMKATG